MRSGLKALKNTFLTILGERGDEISPQVQMILIGLNKDWLWLDERIETVSAEITEIANAEANCRNVMSIPGIGPMISAAMVAAVGVGDGFDRSRDFAA